MVDKKVTELPVALSLIDDDTFYIIQGGLDKRGTYGFLKSEIEKETSDLTAAAQVAADSAEADAIQTAADRVQTGLDATSAASSASSANTSKNLAEQWANENEDVVVASGEYSAKHYSLKAAADAADTAADVIQTNADVVSAAASESKAQQWANEAEDVPVEVGLFSSLHYAAKAAEDLVQTNADVVTTNNNVTTSNNILTNVETIYDNFDDRYLGAKGSDPLVDNDGDPLITGALYFNTTTGMRVYNGVDWQPSTSNAIDVAYNNGSSGLAATDVQAAVDELSAEKEDSSNLGTAAYLDVTTSSTDTTAGRLTKVGDFGLGSTGLPTFSGNADTLVNGGLYSVDSTSTNLPEASNGMMIVSPFLPDATSQIFHAFNTNRQYFRHQASGVWSTWVESYSGNTVATGTGDLVKATSPQLSGVPVVNGSLIVGGTSVDGSEGGQIQLTKSPLSSALNDYYIDQSVDNIRFFSNFAPSQFRIFQLNFNELTDSQTSNIYHQQNAVGIVNQSGGIPTGAIIERGSNVNGEYTKFADGTMICTHDPVGGGATIATGSIYQSSETTWTFPAAFTEVLSVSGSTGAASPRWVNCRILSNTQAAIRDFSSVSDGTQKNNPITAIGYWY